MIKLYFDIETVPADDSEMDVFFDILKKKNGNKDKTDLMLHEETTFEGTFGRICCIGVIKEGHDGKILLKEVFSGDEKDQLKKFWDAAANVHRFIGHNIWSFDLPYIYKRSIIKGVKPRMDISFARYRNIPIYDTMCEWDLWNFGKAQKLDTLAKVLGLPTSKDEMDGSEVWQYFKDGRIDEICRYCMKDVELTRNVYKKMTFEEDENESRSDIPF